jgi:hypothetical protein
MKRLLTVSLVALCATANAEFWDGNKLLERATGETWYEKGVAIGYIMGVTDTTLGISHCAPSNVTAGQVEAMVVQHLRLFPERRARTGDSLVIEVLKATWPCPARTPSPGSMAL